MEMIGNDLVAIIKTYKTSIIKSRSYSSDEYEKIKVEIILAALPVCVFSSLYSLFKDINKGKELSRLFINEFEYLVRSDDLGQKLFGLVNDLKVGSINQIVDGYPDFYVKNINSSVESEEKKWVKNYASAILNQFTHYSKAAINYGFI